MQEQGMHNIFTRRGKTRQSPAVMCPPRLALGTATHPRLGRAHGWVFTALGTCFKLNLALCHSPSVLLLGRLMVCVPCQIPVSPRVGGSGNKFRQALLKIKNCQIVLKTPVMSMPWSVCTPGAVQLREPTISKSYSIKKTQATKHHRI